MSGLEDKIRRHLNGEPSSAEELLRQAVEEQKALRVDIEQLQEKNDFLLAENERLAGIAKNHRVDNDRNRSERKFDKYRFVSPRGVEARCTYNSHWTNVTGHHLEEMTASELRIVADVLEGKRNDN